ncbi:unnamed protein product, partial [Prorocentrum cordatum]
ALTAKAKNVWRLRAALGSLLRRKWVTGYALRAVLGHITWMGMLRREALTTLHACYAFVEVFEGRPGRLWDSAARELITVRNLLPILQADLTAGWYSTIACSDAAPEGLGVARQRLEAAVVASCARFSERWRFKVAGAQATRERPLACGSASEKLAATKNGYRAADADPDAAETPLKHVEPFPNYIVAPLADPILDSGRVLAEAPEEVSEDPEGFAVRFEEVPADITDSPAWRPSAAVQVSGGANILFLEGGSPQNGTHRTQSAAGGMAGSAGGACCAGPRVALLLAVVAVATVGPVGADAARKSRVPSAGAAVAQRQKLAQQARSSRPLLAGLTLLETLAIRANTERSYLQMLNNFVQWCQQHRQDWKSYEELDPVLSSYFSDHYLLGTACNIGSQTLVAIAHVTPSLFKQTVSVLPRASRASAAWKRRAPGKTRLPLPRPAVYAIAGWLISHGQLGMACWVVLAFAAYLRPAEAQGLTHESLAPPAPAAGAGHSCWALLMHPLERGVAGKTGHCDDGVLIDQAPLWPVLAAMRLATPPGASLWSFSLDELTAQFSSARQALKLSSPRPHLYSLRRGGASDDLLTGRRSPLEVQRRGRRAVASSMRRYGKEGSLLDEMARVNAAVFAFGALVEANLSSLLEHGFSRMNLRGQVPATALPALGPVAAAPAARPSNAEDGVCSRHLKRRLRRALRAQRTRRVVLELFADSSHLTEAVRRRGLPALDLDLWRGPAEDHLSREFRAVVKGWLACRVAGAVWLGTPCTTWTQALRQPLRTRTRPMGRADLLPREAAKVRMGNRTFHLSCDVIELCLELRIPVFVENPAGSLIWQARRLQRLLQHPSCQLLTFDGCQYDAPWRKRTSVAAWNAVDLSRLQRRCAGRRGMCSRSNRPHVILTGHAGGAHLTAQ